MSRQPRLPESGQGSPKSASPGWLADLAGAWIFYSALPAWPGLQPRFERIARFAPVVGVVLGALQAGLWLAMDGWIPRPAALALVIALGLVLSGGLHLDGALDTADGLAAGPRALDAMADSRVGAAAVQTAVLLLLLRVAGLVCLVDAVPAALPWAAFWGRCAPLLAMARFPYLRSVVSGAPPGAAHPSGEGSAAFHRRHWRGLGREARPALLSGGLLLAASLAGTAGLGGTVGLPHQGLTVLALALTGVLPALLVPEWLGRRLGGHSGDSYGACVEWTETLALLLTGLALRALAVPV